MGAWTVTFLLGLVAGLIIGWVVEWIIDWQFWRSDADESVAQERQLREELGRAQTEIAALKKQLVASDPPIAAALEVINGIGPEYAQSLFDGGIVTLADLAAATPEQLRNALGAEAWQTANTETWVAAAQSKLNQSKKGE